MIMKKAILAGMVALAAAMDGPMYEKHHEVTGDFSGLKNAPVKNRKPKTMGNHKRSKKRRN